MVKYAVLISAGKTTVDNCMYHSEFWYDLFLMYKTLIDNGFKHDHIFVLYGDGTDFISTRPEYKTSNQFPGVNQITNYPNHKQNVKNIFSWLAAGNPVEGIPEMTDSDFLLVWWMGHGWPAGPSLTDMKLKIENTGEFIQDHEFAGYVNVITHYLKRAFLIMTCFSGGMLNDLQGAKTVVETATDLLEFSASDTYDVHHAEFTYHAVCALREETPVGVVVASDLDNNNLVSLDEGFKYVLGKPMFSTPQISDVSNIAPCIFIKLPTPGKVIEIMSRDYINDNGTTPSNSQTWYHGPDLWVRNSQDGNPTHQDPIYGQTNYVYANIRNLGCENATNITVDFSWCEQTAWANPTLWNHIDTFNIPVLGSLQSITINIPWTNLPLPGTYCLHTRLNCPQDPENSYGQAYMDNNKVQINMTVANITWGVKKPFLFFVENAANENVPIDLEINATQMIEETELRMELSPHIRFKKVENAKVTNNDLGGKILVIKRGVSIIKGVSLTPKSKEKRRLIITINTPMKAKIGQESVIIIEERVQGESKGGIQFISKVSNRAIVVRKLLIRKANLFQKVAGELDLDEARKIFNISRDTQLQAEELIKKKPLVDAMASITKIEERALESAKIQKICRISEDLGNRYLTAIENLKKALKQRNLNRIIEAEEGAILYMEALLSEFIKKRKPKLIKQPE